MKKYIGILMVIGLMSGAFLASAEDNGGSNKGEDKGRPEFNSDMRTERDAFRAKWETDREAFKESLKTNRESFLQELKTRRDEFKTADAGRRTEFWNNAKTMVGQRFETAITNLEKIQIRVAAAILELSESGENTASATENLNLSEQKLSDAKAKIAQIKSLLPATGDKVTPEIFEQIKLLAREAKDLLKESREDLRLAINEIKDLREENGDTDSN